MSGSCHVSHVFYRYLCYTFSSNDKKYTAGAWSPTRPSIIFLGTHEGNVEVWDLLEKTHEASVIQNISTGIVGIVFPEITLYIWIRNLLMLNKNSPNHTAYTLGCIIENEFNSCI